jgi:hypothetical protein
MTGSRDAIEAARVRGRARAEANFAAIREIVRTKHPGAVILSNDYVDKDTPLVIRCEQGHLWNGRPGVISRGGWCRQCSRVRIARGQRASPGELVALVARKGGKLLTPIESVGGNNARVRVKCGDGHQWEPTIGSLRLQRSWCPDCAGVRVDIAAIRKKARSNSGELLSATYVNAQTSMQWRCSRGHTFELNWNKVQSGRWCPRCSGYLGEELCRVFFERAFGRLFPKKRPSWLIDSEESRLELDGYNEALGIAFEHHGDHKRSRRAHFSPKPADFERLQRRMGAKAKLCAARGVTLIEIPEVGTHVRVDQLRDFIIRELECQGVEVPKKAHRVDLTFADVHRRGVRELRALQRIARKQGGELLSTTYAGSSVKLRWRCRLSHEWNALPPVIRKGHWCGTCAGVRKYSIADMRVLAGARGWTCLSARYERVHDKLTWRCELGHVWRNSPAKIRAGQGCPFCSGRRVTLADCVQLARERGGECLSKRYVDAHTKMKWRCTNGHVFTMARSRVVSGRWCSCSRDVC